MKWLESVLGGILLWVMIIVLLVGMSTQQWEFVMCLALSGIYIEMVHIRMDRQKHELKRTTLIEKRIQDDRTT